MVIIKEKFILIINYLTKFIFVNYVIVINYFLINFDNHL
jgi:hypothetical protein